jgi:SAM-dependent methyltransferase
VCAGCRSTFPVVDGIPRLITQDFYWGEVGKSEARRLVDDALALGWKTAVTNRFSATDAGRVSILDWQRASWIPLLGLRKESAVLDIGSGYGAITHALAANYDEVHSIEAIPERVEFTNARMRQEGFRNVRLVNGSALQLPYAPGTFDAIIVNGVLEWIGDWDLEGDPRSAQLRFLRRVHSLLKPGGKLLVGIENRLGYVSFGGAIDHSGLPFTNLLPRPVATAALRVFATGHHRMEAPARSYRTYTYSAAGYRKLFDAAGFTRGTSYWAEPGYNLPYLLVPLTNEGVAQGLRICQANAGNKLSLFGHVKRLLARAGLFKHLVPDFLFILQKDAPAESPWQSVLPARLAGDPQLLLMTHKFSTKTTLFATGPSHAGVLIKCSTPAPESKAFVAAEYAVLESLSARVGRSPALPFSVPAPLGTRTMGRQLLTLESKEPGDQMFMQLFELPQSERLAFLQTHLPALAEAASSISQMDDARRPVASTASWLTHAKTVLGPRLAERCEMLGNRYAGSTAHGDFTIENVLLVPGRPPTIIDWEYARNDLPPLYDHFTMFLSVLSTVTPRGDSSTPAGDHVLARFQEGFFRPNAWSRLFAELTARECARLGVDRAQTWDMFVDSLIFRIGYLVERNSVFQRSRTRFIEAMMDWRDDFQL